MSTLTRLLRSPELIAADCREERDLRAITLTSIACVAVGAAIFGGVLGSFRGGAQIAYAAIKVPIAMLATLAIAAPAFHGLAASLGRAWPMRAIVALALAAAGRAALVLLAFAPCLWLLFDWGLGYHAAAMVGAIAYGIAGLAAVGVLVRGLGEGSRLTAFAFVAVFLAVGAQTSWILRPYLLRPRAAAPVFLRAREGSFLDALSRSSRSAFGFYEDARLPTKESD
jgi:hypothetical protein